MTAAPVDAQTLPHRRILAIVVGLILYGSLYPWQFYARHYGHDPLWILLHTWPVAFDRYILWDVAVNITLYAPLGLFAFLSVGERAARTTRILAPLALGLVLSSSIEMLQLFDDSRQCSLADVAANAAGTLVGMAAGVLYRARLQRLLARPGAAALLRPSGSLLLLSCWLGYQLFPLFPAWGRTSLFHRLATLEAARAGWLLDTPADTLVVFAEWLAVACLLESICKAGIDGALALLLLVLPARLLISNRTLTWPDILGAVAAYCVWIFLPRLWVRRAAPFVLAIALILGELSPFRFTAAQPFSWAPFRGFFRSSWQDGFVVLFHKSFWYGAVLWLWRASGFSLMWTTAVAAAVLFILERVQMYQPGRTPEISDAVLAALMGLLLWLLRDA